MRPSTVSPQGFLSSGPCPRLVVVTMCHHDFGVDWPRTAEETETEEDEQTPSFANESTEAEVELLTDGGDE